jgi:hypothetical protein
LVDSLGSLAGVPKIITDLAGVADRAVYGDGLRTAVDLAVKVMRQKHLRKKK